MGETVLKFTYLYDDFPLENIFLFYGLTEFMLFLVLAWRYGFFYLSKILSAFFTRSLGMGLASSHDGLIFKTNFRLPYFRWREDGATSVLGFWPIISLLFLPFPGYWVQTSVSFHSDPHFLLSPTGREELTYITILS